VVKPYTVEMWPDPAYPADIKTFRKAGYTMKMHTKDVLGGIEAVRAKLNPMGRPPELFFLKGDPGCELLATRTIGYRWKLDTAGRATDTPDDVDDDLCDALRYVVQNEFRLAGKVTVGKDDTKTIAVATESSRQYTTQNWASQKVKELTGAGGSGAVVLGPAKGKKGSFSWDMT
jgi:hypothetical protein